MIDIKVTFADLRFIYRNTPAKMTKKSRASRSTITEQCVYILGRIVQKASELLNLVMLTNVLLALTVAFH